MIRDKMPAANHAGDMRDGGLARRVGGVTVPTAG